MSGSQLISSPGWQLSSLHRVSRVAVVTGLPARIRMITLFGSCRSFCSRYVLQPAAAILGHDKLDTTMQYVVLDNTDVRNSYRKFA